MTWSFRACKAMEVMDFTFAFEDLKLNVYADSRPGPYAKERESWGNLRFVDARDL